MYTTLYVAVVVSKCSINKVALTIELNEINSILIYQAAPRHVSVTFKNGANTDSDGSNLWTQPNDVALQSGDGRGAVGEHRGVIRGEVQVLEETTSITTLCPFASPHGSNLLYVESSQPSPPSIPFHL